MKPLRQGAGLEADGGDAAILFSDPTHEHLGLTATCASFTIFPCSLTTQIAIFANDTSNPTNSLIPQSSFWFDTGTATACHNLASGNEQCATQDPLRHLITSN
jgi:hypothetical protein